MKKILLVTGLLGVIAPQLMAGNATVDFVVDCEKYPNAWAILCGDGHCADVLNRLDCKKKNKSYDVSHGLDLKYSAYGSLTGKSILSGCSTDAIYTLEADGAYDLKLLPPPEGSTEKCQVQFTPHTLKEKK